MREGDTVELWQDDELIASFELRRVRTRATAKVVTTAKPNIRIITKEVGKERPKREKDQ